MREPKQHETVTDFLNSLPNTDWFGRLTALQQSMVLDEICALIGAVSFFGQSVAVQQALEKFAKSSTLEETTSFKKLSARLEKAQRCWSGKTVIERREYMARDTTSLLCACKVRAKNILQTSSDKNEALMRSIVIADCFARQPFVDHYKQAGAVLQALLLVNQRWNTKSEYDHLTLLDLFDVILMECTIAQDIRKMVRRYIHATKSQPHNIPFSTEGWDGAMA